MKIKKGNRVKAIKNNQENNVVVEGVCTAEELVDLGVRTGKATLDALAKMYPKNVEYENAKFANIQNEELNNVFKEAAYNNKERIDAIYQRKETESRLRETQMNIANEIKKAKKDKETSYVKELENRVRELEGEKNVANQ